MWASAKGRYSFATPTAIDVAVLLLAAFVLEEEEEDEEEDEDEEEEEDEAEVEAASSFALPGTMVYPRKSGKPCHPVVLYARSGLVGTLAGRAIVLRHACHASLLLNANLRTIALASSKGNGDNADSPPRPLYRPVYPKKSGHDVQPPLPVLSLPLAL